MGSKDVRTDSGGSLSSEPGLYLRVPCGRGKPYPGSSGNLPVSGRTMPSGRDGFGTWKRKTQKPESKISGTVPPVSGTPDDL